jgi:hypothetical protein
MTQITTSEIFDANQVLTVAKAKELKGKKIATTNAEYHANKPCVNIFTVGKIVSAWDDAATREYPGEKFKTYQEYWASYMTSVQIDEMKTKLILFSIEGNAWHVAHTKYNNWYKEPTFTGSDADREIYYLIIHEITCKKCGRVHEKVSTEIDNPYGDFFINCRYCMDSDDIDAINDNYKDHKAEINKVNRFYGK